MNDFSRVDKSLSACRLFIAVALILVSGCASVQKTGIGYDSALRPHHTRVDERPVGSQCPIRQMYVCERRFRTRPGDCYCTPESAILQPGTGAGRLF